MLCLPVKGRREVTSSEGMVSGQCFGKSRFALFKEFSNVSHVDVPPAVSHPTVHDDVGHGPDFSALLSKGTNQYHKDIGVGCPHHDIACCDIYDVESNQRIGLFMVALEVCWAGYSNMMVLVWDVLEAFATVRSKQGLSIKDIPVMIFPPLLQEKLGEFILEYSVGEKFLPSLSDCLIWPGYYIY